MNDLISIIIPVRNGEKYLSQCIESIIQQEMNTEIIVVDDFSDDSTVEIAKKYNCLIVKHDIQKGQVAGKNSGLKAAKGKYILFQDYDDIMNKSVLKKLYKELIENNDCAAIEAKIQDFYTPELSVEERNKIIIRKEPYWGLFTGAILMKKDIFDTIGLFDEKFQACEIIDWQSKMNSFGLKIKKTDIISVNRRIHLTNYGRMNKNNEYKDYAAILRAKFKKESFKHE
ncbi:glycosyltransferase family 2 protein [bacterium]|nr:glycosyltransferase family 2 protein [bacterium]